MSNPAVGSEMQNSCTWFPTGAQGIGWKRERDAVNSSQPPAAWPQPFISHQRIQGFLVDGNQPFCAVEVLSAAG